jgi:hypothetical protein
MAAGGFRADRWARSSRGPDRGVVACPGAGEVRTGRRGRAGNPWAGGCRRRCLRTHVGMGCGGGPSRRGPVDRAAESAVGADDSFPAPAAGGRAQGPHRVRQRVLVGAENHEFHVFRGTPIGGAERLFWHFVDCCRTDHGKELLLKRGSVSVPSCGNKDLRRVERPERNILLGVGLLDAAYAFDGGAEG